MKKCALSFLPVLAMTLMCVSGCGRQDYGDPKAFIEGLKKKSLGFQQARDKLTSEKGLEHRSKRPIEPEAVFGQMKYDMHYKRFRHFGKDKVTMDFALFAIAFNIKKMIAKMKRAA